MERVSVGTTRETDPYLQRRCKQFTLTTLPFPLHIHNTPNTHPTSTQLTPVHIQYTPSTHPVHTQYAPKTHPIRTQDTHSTHTVHNQHALNIHPIHTQYTPNTHQIHTKYAPSESVCEKSELDDDCADYQYAAGCKGLTDNACHVFLLKVDPRSLSETESHDVASIICQSLPAARSGERFHLRPG